VPLRHFPAMGRGSVVSLVIWGLEGWFLGSAKMRAWLPCLSGRKPSLHGLAMSFLCLFCFLRCRLPTLLALGRQGSHPFLCWSFFMNWKIVLSSFTLATSLFASGAHAQAAQDNLLADTQTPLYADTCSPDGSANVFLSPENNNLFLNDWYDPQDPVYEPFATYSLTPEEQAAYLALIQEFWPGVYDNMQPWEINDEMADVINTMVETIANCSQGLAAVNSFVGAVKTFRDTSGLLNPKKWATFIRKYKQDLLQGLGILRYNRRHGHCVTVASANWRSTFEMAYGQYWW